MTNSYKNYEWFLKKDLSKFSGKWVAVVDKKVVASDKNVKKMIQEVKLKFPNKKPFVTKIRDKLSIL